MSISGPQMLVAVGLFVGMAAGCTERQGEMIYAPPERPEFSLAEIAGQVNGTTLLSMDTEIQLFGPYDGYPQADAARRRRFQELHGTDLNLFFSEVNYIFGSSQPPAIDVGQARVHLGQEVFQVRNRAGALILPPNLPPQVHGASQGGEPRPSPLPEGGGGGGECIPDPPLIICPESLMPAEGEGSRNSVASGHASADRVLVTADGAHRTLEQLVESFTEAPRTGNMRTFRQTRGDTEVLVAFDPRVGAVTRSEVHEKGRLIASTESRYELVQNRAILVEEVTQFYDAEGNPQARAVSFHRNHTLR